MQKDEIAESCRILGVPLAASLEETEKAYKKLARKYHPDLNRENIEEAERKMCEINNAYGLLKKYLAENKNTIRQKSSEDTSAEASGGGWRKPSPSPGGHSEIFEKFIHPEIKRGICSYCKGTGKITVKKTTKYGRLSKQVPCDQCGGTGKIK